MNAHLIDDVARRLTEVVPPADLRARVIAQLADRPSPWRAWRPAVAAATVLIAVAGFGLQRRFTVAQTAGLPLPASPALVRDIGGAALVPAAVTTAPLRPRRVAKPAIISAAELAWRARVIPAIAAAQPLAAESIQPASLTLPLLELKPLVNTPVTVAPISAADASGGR